MKKSANKLRECRSSAKLAASPKIALNGRANEGERKLGKKDQTMDEREVEGRTVSNVCKKRKSKNGDGGKRSERGKKTSVSTSRPGESSQNEVRPHELMVHKPVYSPLSSLRSSWPSLSSPSQSPRSYLPSWIAGRGIKPRSHKALLISYFFLRHVLHRRAVNQFITGVKCAVRDINYLFSSKRYRIIPVN